MSAPITNGFSENFILQGGGKYNRIWIVSSKPTRLLSAAMIVYMMVQTEERRLVSTLEGMQVELLAQYYYSPSTLGPIQRPTHNFPIGSCSPVSWSYFSRKSHSVSLGFESPLPIRSFRVLIISAASSSISSCPASSPSPALVGNGQQQQELTAHCAERKRRIVSQETDHGGQNINTHYGQ